MIQFAINYHAIMVATTHQHGGVRIADNERSIIITRSAWTFLKIWQTRFSAVEENIHFYSSYKYNTYPDDDVHCAVISIRLGYDADIF